MKTLKRTVCIFLVLAMAAMLTACKEKDKASDYPTGPITVVVGYSAGGGSDLIARKLAEGMGKELGVAFSIQNVAGGSASVAGQQVLSAKQDGYTLLAGPCNAAAPWRVADYCDYGWDNFYSLIGANSWYALMVAKDSEFTTLEEFVAYAQGHPGEMTWGHSGFGSLNQVSGDTMLKMLDIKADGVPYGSGSEVATKVIAGDDDFTWLPLNDAAAFVNSGDVRCLCVARGEDMEISTVNGSYTVPSMVKAYPETAILDGILGWGLHIPRNTPEDAVKALVEAFKTYSASADYKEFCDGVNVVPATLYGEEADRQCAVMESFVSWGLYDLEMAPNSPEKFEIPRVDSFTFPANDRARNAPAWPAE